MSLARACTRGDVELMEGDAGRLVAGSMVVSGDDDGLRHKLDNLAEGLLKKWFLRARRRWHPIDATNIAHGWLGVAYALLRSRVALPDRFVASLSKLASTWRIDVVSRADMRASWCTGAAGTAMAWAAAFERTHDSTFLARANDAASAAYDLSDGTRTHLCCGMGGVAYALLAMERVDPGRGWREKARELGARAIQTPLRSQWPNGLLWGHPGLVCLALDLMSDEPRGFPLIED
jgi:hypothetical protein